ncbi:MAG: hypothetical protein K2X74_13230 [Acetobacteraceae bacterium]|nr:hypothetical protein [Acetobacteraceae bacterium]
MRETSLERDGARRRIRTDDRGTSVLDAGGMVQAEHGTDRHDMLLEQHLAEGWRALEDGHAPPAGAADLPPPDLTPERDPGSPTATVRSGEAG